MPAPNVAIQYYGIDKPVLPYKSNTSVVDESPHWVSGSQNAMATITGWVEKRPGFSTSLETVLSSIPGRLVRIFPWRRWAGTETKAGSFFWMVCSTTGSTSTVWKYEVGADSSFSLLYTDTLTTQPFDFVVSNNFCFFGNESTRTNMRKYDGTLCTLWGVDRPNAAPEFNFTAGSLPPGLSFNSATGVLSGTPTSISSNSITFTVKDAVGASASQIFTFNIDPATLAWKSNAGPIAGGRVGTGYAIAVAAYGGTMPYTFSLASGSLPAGLNITTSGLITGTPTTSGLSSFSLLVVDALGAMQTRGFSIFVSDAALLTTPTTLPNGAPVTGYSQTLSSTGGTAPYSYSVVYGSLPLGIALSSAGVISGNPTIAGNYPFTVMVSDSTTLVEQLQYVLKIISPSLAITTDSIPDAKVGSAYSFTLSAAGGSSPYAYTFTAGSITAQTGYAYGQTFTSVYGHESSMSDLSTNTGLFTDKDVAVTVVASSDIQVSGINLYRTSDGGTQDPSSMFLVASLSNTNQVYNDATPDTSLSTQTGPALYVNDPPQPLSGFVWSNGRIWGKKNSKTWFTGNEEITNGIPEECMSDAINGNFYAWPSEVGGMAVTPEGVDIGLSEQYWQISGDALATFQKSVLLTGGGVRSPINVISVGSTVFWIDTAKQVFSSSSGEIGEPIRPDLMNIDPMQTFIVYFKSKTFNLLVILDALNGVLLTYDFDLGQWNTPWPVPGMTSIGAGEGSLGNIQLVAGFSSGHVRILTPSTFTDDGNPYSDQLRCNLISISPGRGTTARNRAEVRQVVQYEMETNTTANMDGSFTPNTPTQFYDLRDDDPIATDIGLWNDLTGNQTGMQFGNSQNARYLGSSRWIASGSDFSQQASRVSLCANWDASTTYWRVYTFDVAWRSV